MIFVSELEVSSYFFVSNAENEEDTEEISNRYANRDRNLTELTTIQFIDLQKEISNAELAKKFVREYQKMTDKLHKK
jgi:predicted HTH transcriptional regulator